MIRIHINRGQHLGGWRGAFCIVCVLILIALFPLIPLTASGAQEKKASRPKRVSLDFKDVELPLFIRFVSDVTGKSFVFDERVRGKVTIFSPEGISSDELYNVFLSILDFKGYTALPHGKVIRIVPSRLAKQSSGEVIADGKRSEKEGYITRLITLRFIKAADVVRILAPLISKDGSLNYNADTNTLVITDSPFNIDKLVSIVKGLDKEPPPGRQIFVYYLENADAVTLAKTLNELFSKSRPQAQPPRPGFPVEDVISKEIAGPVSVTAEKDTNALIIYALPQDFEVVKGVIRQLDIRRRQVFVEAAIIEISLSRLKELGFEFRALNDFSGDAIKGLGGTNFGGIGAAVTGPEGLANISGLVVGVVKGTFTFGGKEYLNVGALVRALKSETGVNILSTPQLLTTDNQKAEIVVGENVPIITGQTVTTGGTTQTSIERRDIGVTLRLTPHITEGDFVRLEIYQEISSLSESPASTFFDPNVVGPLLNKRYAETSVVVKDGETIVIAGLIKDNKTEVHRKVPLLGDIPLLGALFQYKKDQVDKTNLMIFLTPTIIKEADTLKGISKEKEKEMEGIKEKGLD